MAIDVYDDSIFYLDRHFWGSCSTSLASRSVLDDTLVIVASDHGEHLGDHGLFFHGCSLYRQVVGVPLVIVDPRRVPEGRVIARSGELARYSSDHRRPAWAGGKRAVPGPLARAALGRAKNRRSISPAEPLLMEAGKPPGLTNQGREPVAKGPMQALVAEGDALHTLADGLEELYLLNSDPEERSNLAVYSFAQEILQQFRTRLSTMLKKRPPSSICRPTGRSGSRR